LTTDEKAFRSSDDVGAALLHKEGVAVTDLHPAGKALIDGHRADVVSESGYIGAGEHIRVIAVEGIRVIVRASKTPAASS
jgi:membrane-bound serine protease (ClpP class)